MDDSSQEFQEFLTLEIVQERLQKGWEAFVEATSDLDAALDPLIVARRRQKPFHSIDWTSALPSLSRFLREYAVPAELPVKAAGRGRGQAVFAEMLNAVGDPGRLEQAIAWGARLAPEDQKHLLWAAGKIAGDVKREVHRRVMAGIASDYPLPYSSAGEYVEELRERGELPGPPEVDFALSLMAYSTPMGEPFAVD
jgi:FAD/FMN-containing dehydrogenase